MCRSMAGCENSFIAPTIFDMRATPSSDCEMALGTSSRRYATSATVSNCASSSPPSVPAPARVSSACSTENTSVIESFRKRTLSPMNWVGVLISCAMPADSWPMDSSFWAWASSCSSFFCCVMSMLRPYTPARVHGRVPGPPGNFGCSAYGHR